MSSVPQASPDLQPGSPEPKAPGWREKSKTTLWITGLLLLGLASLFLSSSVLFRSRKSADKTEALYNVRLIGLHLFAFESDYGSFPSAKTIPDVKSRTSTPLTLGDDSSNQLFRQLLVTHLKDEKPFHAKISGAKKPDGRFDSDATALARGECSFSYISGLRSGDNPGFPLVMTPLIPGTSKFARVDELGDDALILRLDCSASFAFLDPSGKVPIASGLTLFDPKVWGSVKPDLRWPE